MSLLLPFWLTGLLLSLAAAALMQWYLRTSITTGTNAGPAPWLWPTTYLLVLLAMSATFIIGFAVERWWWHTLEDGIVEWASFWLHMLASITFVWIAWESRLTSLNFLAIVGAVFTFGVAGEEISWGQRVLGFTPPEAVLSRNLQGELTIHNLEIRGVYLAKYLQAFGPMVLFGTILAWLKWFPDAARRRAGFGFNRHLAALLGLLALFMLLSSFAFPTRVVEPLTLREIPAAIFTRHASSQAELAEGLFAATMLLAALGMRMILRPKVERSSQPSP